ncbi:hypothetical protein B0I35DRAFT_364953 [Stachybotrys elegans]|uniref:MARVEL domain-containing protein n=1 Tax=Stachybotrys elegans TaxID=80388 RepID=A0A8K0WJH7_9HYPO|nr:hypothetical protein B0I35DRAFT_364953 [Stachybotrys elegans]
MKAVELGRSARDLAGTASQFRQADKGELGRQAGQSAFAQGADVGKQAGKTWLKTFEVIPRLICRGTQFIFAIIACGFYGNRVDADRRGDDGYSPEWLFAITVAGISAISAALFMAVAPLSALPVIGSRLKLFKTYRAFAWDLGLFICWLVVFGIFAAIFLHRDGEDARYKGSNTTAMRTAVWVDLVNAIFWMFSGAYGCIKVFLGEKVDNAVGRVGNRIFRRKAASAKETELNNYAGNV